MVRVSKPRLRIVWVLLACALVEGIERSASATSHRRTAILAPAMAVCAFIGVCAATIIVVEHGHFTYPLDDPYIHFALAKNIARGHYGINPGEFAAPSSSILWPFFLAPFATLSFAIAVPVIFNTACAFGTVALFAALADDVLSIPPGARKRNVVVALSLLFAVATNQIGLALLGMEHSLQLLCAVWLATLLVRDAKPHLPGPSSLAIGCAIAFGPLIRYEMVGPSLLATAYFLMRGRRAAAGGFLVALAGLGAFSAALVANGVGPLPTSVLAKSGATLHQSFVVTALTNVRMQLHAGWAVILAFFGFAFGVWAVRKQMAPRDRPLAAILLLVLAGHLLVGRSGWFGRYETYALAFAYVLGLGLFASELTAWTSRRPPLAKLLGLAGFALVLSLRYAAISITTPLGALNVYEQQAQVARFVGEYYRRPVGVNDLGYVAWRSDSYVLDFIGLGSLEALRAQQLHPNDAGAWVGELTAKHDVRFAAIYDAWFKNLPSSWVPCGSLHLGSKRITASMDTVTFYALDEETRVALGPELRSWMTSLPTSTRFELADACR